MFKFKDTLNEKLCKENPDALIIFGDNLIGKGKLGQAIIRDEPNAFGVPTKRLPSMKEGSFFSDKEDEIKAISSKLEYLLNQHDLGKTIILPSAKIGSGLASLESNSPKIANIVNAFYHYAKECVENENKINLTISWASEIKDLDKKLSSEYGVLITDTKNMRATIIGNKENISNFLTSCDYGMSYEDMISEFPELNNTDNSKSIDESYKSTNKKVRRAR